MSRPTPRKHNSKGNHNQSHPSLPQSHSFSSSQQQQQQHGHGHGQGHARTRSQHLQAQQHLQQYLITSDYESDTAHYMAAHPAIAAPATLAARTNTELNLSVLQRYVPSITSILAIAANAVVYTFSEPAAWNKSLLEGPMFICSQGGPDGVVSEKGCLFILNRKGLQNLVLDLNTVSNFELSGDLLIFKLDDESSKEIPMEDGQLVTPSVIGLWTYAENEGERQTNAALIYEMWAKVREAREARELRTAAGLSNPTQPTNSDVGPAAQAMGRRVSLTDLFGGRMGGVGA
ncbi:hypothetical protein F4780DRAFT_568308 [Xylariomycetidae sp. FL0641]|nr:hypothetical protein F4780DRAFT_568308 [Xylariomycetidae sp. FL0641]